MTFYGPVCFSHIFAPSSIIGKCVSTSTRGVCCVAAGRRRHDNGMRCILLNREIHSRLWPARFALAHSRLEFYCTASRRILICKYCAFLFGKLDDYTVHSPRPAALRSFKRDVYFAHYPHIVTDIGMPRLPRDSRISRQCGLIGGDAGFYLQLYKIITICHSLLSRRRFARLRHFLRRGPANVQPGICSISPTNARRVRGNRLDLPPTPLTPQPRDSIYRGWRFFVQFVG